METNVVQTLAKKMRENIESVIIGKTKQINIILAAFLAGKHVLLDDVPGTGKTMLAKSLARTVNLRFGRIQFTPDLLPSDLTGINMYNPKSNDFVLKRGAVFTQILLADEINRATPRTQSALLECMEERQVTIDGVSYKLEEPFFVIATQNPIETYGTFPLPEAQLDRFAVKLSLGYPAKEDSVDILRHFNGENRLDKLQPVCSAEELKQAGEYVNGITVNDDILTYIITLTEKTRQHSSVSLGVSIRGAIALMDICKAYAALEGRSFVIPDYVQYLAPYVFAHRMIYRAGVDRGYEIVAEIINETPPPVEKWDEKNDYGYSY